MRQFQIIFVVVFIVRGVVLDVVRSDRGAQGRWIACRARKRRLLG
ncbi:MAG TPA: hypothetical protein VIH85_28150 [Solirubrobacteraceae bacterium]